jgi:hypothetical protein
MSKMNDMIPMTTPQGESAFVNTWDVEKRKANGWTVVGSVDDWTGRETAPDFVNPAKGVAAPVAPIDPAAERARVKAIARAADDSQESLADKLIADGVPEADALKALAADAAARKAKTGKAKKSDAGEATGEPPQA